MTEHVDDHRGPAAAPRAGRLPREAWIVFVVALVVRLAALKVLGSADKPPLGRATFHDFGWEEFAVAESVARGEGFADTFGGGTGPSAWVAPVYPVLVAGLIRIFGGLNPSLAFTLFALQAMLSAATAVLLWRVGLNLGGQRLGRASAWVYALYPVSVYYPVTVVWHTTLSAFVLTWFFAALTTAGPQATNRESVKVGLLFGAAVLVSPAPLATLPVVFFYLCRYRDSAGEAARVALSFGASAALVCAPWIVRNLVVLGTPALRTNLGVELMVGNNDSANGGFNALLHPSQSEEEHAYYAQLQEVDYAAFCMRRFFEWARAHPVRFAELTGWRYVIYWFGRPPTHVDHWDQAPSVKADLKSWVRFGLRLVLGVAALAGLATFRGAAGQRILLAGALLLYPAVYGFTHVLGRYRFPIEPMMTLAATSVVCQLVCLWRRRRSNHSS